MDIVTIKLTSGEEVIARLKENTESHITLNTPRLMILTEGQQPGSLTLQLMPWLYGCDQDGDTPPLDKAGILAMNTRVPKQLEDRYLDETSSIQLVK